MASQSFQGYLLNDAGAAIVGATVDLLDRNTTTPVRATTTTAATGLWTISHATEGRFDVRITNGSSVRWHKYDTQEQIDTLEVANFNVRNPADTFDYAITPGAITADRILNLPVITGTDTLAVLGLAQTWSAAQNFGANIVYINDTANANMTVGLTINQGGADNLALVLKSDHSTGLTTGTVNIGTATFDVETDDYLAVSKTNAAGGGVTIQVLGISSLATPFYLFSYGGAPATTDTSASLGAQGYYVAQHDGANALSDMAADSDAFTWGEISSSSAPLTRMLLKADDGELHLGNTTLVGLDAEDDVQIVRAMQRVSASSGIIETGYENPFYDYGKLRELGLAGEKDAEGFFLFPLQSRLHAHEGAIWQLYVRQEREVAALKTEIEELRRMLPAA